MKNQNVAYQATFLSEALDMIRESDDRRDIDHEIVIIPPGGLVTDEEDILDDINEEITLNDIHEVAATFEINRAGILESDDEVDEYDDIEFETVKDHVSGILLSDRNINEKVDRLIDQARILQGGCNWRTGEEEIVLAAEKSEGLSKEALENREKLIEQQEGNLRTSTLNCSLMRNSENS